MSGLIISEEDRSYGQHSTHPAYAGLQMASHGIVGFSRIRTKKQGAKFRALLFCPNTNFFLMRVCAVAFALRVGAITVAMALGNRNLSEASVAPAVLICVAVIMSVVVVMI